MSSMQKSLSESCCMIKVANIFSKKISSDNGLDVYKKRLQAIKI